MSRYRVIRVLGCNLTCTQLARDVMTDRLVILRRVSRSDPLACRQFAREADLLLKLQGRNAPCVYECLETKDERILVEEYIQGRRLLPLPGDSGLRYWTNCGGSCAGSIRWDICIWI